MDIDPAHATEQIIDAFGGVGPLAAKLNLPENTVQGWKTRGLIPQSRHAEIAAAAARENIALDSETLAASDAGWIGSGDAPVMDEPPPPPAPDAAFVVKRSPIVMKERSVAGTLGLVLSLLTLIALAVGGYAAWQYYFQPLAARVADLESRPVATDRPVTASTPNPPDAGVDKLGAEIAKQAQALQDVQSALAALESRVSAAAAPQDTPADADRLAAIEKQVNDLRAGAADTAQLAKKLSELQVAASGRELLAQSIADIQSSIAATQGQVGRLSTELAAVGARVDSNQQALANRKQQSLRAEGLMLAVGELRTALRTNTPFAKDLEAVRTLAPGDQEIAGIVDKLQPYADEGVPSKQDLRADFDRIAPNIVRSEVVRDGKEWWREALYHIESVISVRRVGALVKGDSVDAHVAQAQEKLDEDDWNGAIAALKSLTGAPADVAQPWLHDAQARVDVDAAEAELTRISIERVASGNATGSSPAASKASGSDAPGNDTGDSQPQGQK